jgi:PAS domain-containing protein
MVSISSDITETKQTERALRELEAMLRSFFDSAGVMRGIVELEQNDILHISGNALAAAFFGETTPTEIAAGSGKKRTMEQFFSMKLPKPRPHFRSNSCARCSRGKSGELVPMSTNELTCA